MLGKGGGHFRHNSGRALRDERLSSLLLDETEIARRLFDGWLSELVQTEMFPGR